MQSAILLQETTLNIIENTNQKCQTFLSNSSIQTNSKYCAMGKNSNMCVGDSGKN